VIEVGDDGTGITPDDLGYVFESFRSGAGGGTGMGLAIVKAIVEAHRGMVSVVSNPVPGRPASTAAGGAANGNADAAAGPGDAATTCGTTFALRIPTGTAVPRTALNGTPAHIRSSAVR
jgi:signal transduction histidine kinase